jgi:iron complex transport system permease protein
VKTALTAAIILLALAGLLSGPAGFGMPDPLILWQLRLPRTALALLVGAALGLAGAVLQGALRNPLADSGLLGIGGCAGLGAVVVYYWGLTAAFAPTLPLGGLAGAALGCAALMAMTGRGLNGTSLILAGVALSAFASALLTLALAFAPNPFALAEITFWLMGGLGDRAPLHLALAAPPIALGCLLLLRLGAGLDALSLGEDVATSLGRPVRRTLAWAAIGVALAVGAATAVAGGIGFVGLVAPHIARMLVGEDQRHLLPASAVAGALLLSAASVASKLILPGTVFPIGIVTSLIGVPFFAWLVLARGGRR